jgi:hypothetical protein
MTRQATTVQAITLPTWSDPISITAYLGSLVVLVLPFITVLHPGFNPPASSVQAALTAVGLVVAGGIQVFNFIRHTVLHKAAIATGLPLAVIGKGRQVISAGPTVATPVIVAT